MYQVFFSVRSREISRDPATENYLVHGDTAIPRGYNANDIFFSLTIHVFRPVYGDQKIRGPNPTLHLSETAKSLVN